MIRPVRLSRWPFFFATDAFVRRRAAFSRAREPLRRDTYERSRPEPGSTGVLFVRWYGLGHASVESWTWW